MSYSFFVKAATGAAVMAAAGEKMAEVVAAQPVHAYDKDQALAHAAAIVGQMQPNENQDISVSMSGSIWKDGDTLKSLSIAADVTVVDKEKAAA